MKKVKFSIQRFGQKKTAKKGVPLVIIYHPLLKSLSQTIHDNLYFLYMNEELKDLFPSGPMISFRCSRKLRTYLVRAKLYTLNRSVGSSKCKRARCQICTNVNEIDTFTSTFTEKTYRINHEFSCVDKCLIYRFRCNKCNKQYVGQTVEKILLEQLQVEFP